MYDDVSNFAAVTIGIISAGVVVTVRVWSEGLMGDREPWRSWVFNALSLTCINAITADSSCYFSVTNWLFVQLVAIGIYSFTVFFFFCHLNIVRVRFGTQI